MALNIHHYVGITSRTFKQSLASIFVSEWLSQRLDY